MNDDMTPEERHAIADAIGRGRAGGGFMRDLADMLDSIAIDTAQTAAKTGTEEQIGDLALKAARLADMLRAGAIERDHIMNDAADYHGIQRPPTPTSD